MFIQTYSPISPIGWSFGLAILPLIVLCVLLIIGRTKPTATYLIILFITIFLASVVWKMPLHMVAGTVFYGILFGVFPLFYIIWSSVFLFRVAERCGYIEVIKNSLMTVGDRMEWKILLVGFGLTAFIDSTAGFLTPIAISAALLSQLGVGRERSAIAALTACAVPAVFGAVGIPVLLLAQVTGQSIEEILRQCVVSDFIPAFLAPLLTCWAACGWRSARAFLLPCLLGGFSYSLATLASVAYLSPYLGAAIGAVVFIVVILIMVRMQDRSNGTWTWSGMSKGWRPFVLLTVFVVVWNLPVVKQLLLHLGGQWGIPGLDRRVFSSHPFGEHAVRAIWNGQVVASAGTAIIVASLVTALSSGMTLREWGKSLVDTLFSMRVAAINLSVVCSVGFLLVYSGMAGTIAYPFQYFAESYLIIAPFMGWLGTFLTGSNSASIGLFGGLQTFAAQMTHVSPAAIAASFSVAAAGGKMVAPQALEVALQSTNLEAGKESVLLRKVLGFSLFIPIAAIGVAFFSQLFGII
ncbi:L-lactate permease [Fodinisporobacter ferrooxydans]|uniref:L-lactate permease n=1 Tax=Fodinisporobacter ferrooxydans TaxID=2901836 RepID=A0ABY4CQE8_9BACL|nr:L-lactate permease [Alicyclobacillaceae bacterium MYW30-H2]